MELNSYESTKLTNLCYEMYKHSKQHEVNKAFLLQHCRDIEKMLNNRITKQHSSNKCHTTKCLPVIKLTPVVPIFKIK